MAAGSPAYDRIGVGYGAVRRPDPRWAAAIHAALGPGRRVLNVGAGTGSYEPPDRAVVAVEPSAVMLDQHPGRTRVQAAAGSLPITTGTGTGTGTGTFDAAMAVLTVHHWPDLEAGLAELRRVSGRQVLVVYDPSHPAVLWFHQDYLPELDAFERSRHPALERVAELSRAHTVLPLPIPHNFLDGFQHAFWRRPEAFCDPEVRTASSMFAVLGPEAVEPAVARLAADLRSGAWAERHRRLLTLEEVDYGYRLLIAG